MPARHNWIQYMSTFLKDDFTGTGALSAHAVSGDGATGVASTNFTATANEAVSGSVAITPATTGTGTFSPSSPTIASGATSTTFTYTPAVSEAASISISNGAGLSVAGSPITYTSSAASEMRFVELS